MGIKKIIIKKIRSHINFLKKKFNASKGLGIKFKRRFGFKNKLKMMKSSINIVKKMDNWILRRFNDYLESPVHPKFIIPKKKKKYKKKHRQIMLINKKKYKTNLRFKKIFSIKRRDKKRKERKLKMWGKTVFINYFSKKSKSFKKNIIESRLAAIKKKHNGINGSNGIGKKTSFYNKLKERAKKINFEKRKGSKKI